MSKTQGIRLAKLMASRGLCSRREAEKWMDEGRVTVDGETIYERGYTVTEDRVVQVDGQDLPDLPPSVYYLLYKPKGYITGRNDPKGRKSVLDLVEHLNFRVEPVGRLDYDTEGALLLTNDGELANQLTHPSNEIPKRYMAKVYRCPDEGDLQTLRRGVFLDDGRTAPAKVRVVEQTDTSNAWVEITVTEGRNRLIRRMMAQLGHPVSKLRRESFATLSLRGMERGDVRPLTSEEVRRLTDLGQGKTPKSAGKLRRKKGFAKPKPKLNRRKKKTGIRRKFGKGASR